MEDSQLALRKQLEPGQGQEVTHTRTHTLTGGCRAQAAPTLLPAPQFKHTGTTCKPTWFVVVPCSVTLLVILALLGPSMGTVRSLGEDIGLACVLAGEQAAPGEKMHFVESPTVMLLWNLLLLPLGKVVSLTGKKKKQHKKRQPKLSNLSQKVSL